jgi:cytidylate kinase
MPSQAATPPLIVTIDGPAGAGKSTVARRLAQRLGVDFLDTGAMYRGVAAASLSHGVPATDHAAMGDLAERLHIVFDWTKDPPHLKVDGIDLTHRLRDADVTGLVSEVAANPRIRAVLVHAQRWIGKQHPRLVTEGRDQGSVVFPDSAVKFYLDASAAVRAKRRAEQLAATGHPADEAKLLRQITDRDHRDTTRSDGPLICPADAIRIDTSGMDLEQVIDLLARHVSQKIAGAPR